MTPEQATKLVVENGVTPVMIGVLVLLVLGMFAVLMKQNSAMFDRIVHGENGNGMQKRAAKGALFPKQDAEPAAEPSLVAIQKEVSRLANTMATRPCMQSQPCPAEPDVPEWLQPKGGA